MGAILGVPIIRTIVFGVYIGVPYFGKLLFEFQVRCSEAA